MKHSCSALICLAMATCLTIVGYGAAQVTQNADSPKSGALLTKLYDPTYPPLARQARITGDVDVMLTIRRDGSVESAVVVSGHPMLREAALVSAQQSQFECGRCGTGTSYELKYKFQLTAPANCESRNEKQPAAEVDLSRHQVTVSSQVMQICDPAARILKVHSAKCLYLWRCSTRYEL